MSDYAKISARADASLRRKGGPVTLRRPARGTYDPATGGSAGGAGPAEYIGTGVKLAYEADQVDGTLIKRGDVQLLLSPLQRNGQVMPAPQQSDLILIGALTYTIQFVSDLTPTDTNVLYTLQLRGA